ncbi:DUF397 domain-containing protein [Actinomadura bangladeshensis]|uniref:DUF397 domain-containing protein n=1 Tax=Actinomadura bangladeshensis TaxID=453573 RepID=A0A4R4NUR2_9ACTN|nr:DUF397 domain-containing protein [Actinomadura bangladeshensis]TDC13215.1 DUF397 domain-containing protein [Actinomadura bangladeshensis]
MSTTDRSAPQWRKSSRSSGQGGACVEVAALAPAVAVRDSKDPDGPCLTLVPTAWQALTDHIKSGTHDLP